MDRDARPSRRRPHPPEARIDGFMLGWLCGVGNQDNRPNSRPRRDQRRSRSDHASTLAAREGSRRPAVADDVVLVRSRRRELGQQEGGTSMDVRRSGIVFCVALSAAALWVAGPGASLAGAATGGGECQLQGVANISPPLSSNSGSFAYNFTGTLSSCQSNVAGAPTTGNVSAGIQLPETVTLTCTRPGTCTSGFCDDRTTACTTSSQCPAVVFSPTTQDQNCVTMGVSSANISGTVGIGSAQ